MANTPVEVPLPVRTCLRCHHTWTPRAPRTRMCPGCRSAYWDVKKSKGKRK